MKILLKQISYENSVVRPGVAKITRKLFFVDLEETVIILRISGF